MDKKKHKGADTIAIDVPITLESPEEYPTDTIEEVAEVEEDNSSTSDIISLLKGAVQEGLLVQDFKTKLALSGLMKDTDDLHIGRLSKTGQFHMALINQKDSSHTFKVLVAGVLTPMKKEDYDKYFLSGVYLGTDLVMYVDNDSLILVRDAIIIMSNGSIEKF